MLRLFLADVSGAAIKEFGGALTWLVGVALAVAGLVRLFRGREATKLETPIAVAKHKEFAPLDRLEQAEKSIEALRDQRRTDVASLHRKIEEGIRVLNDGVAEEIKEVRSADARHQSDIASVKTEIAHIIRQMQVLDAKVDHLPERILKLLGRSAS